MKLFEAHPLLIPIQTLMIIGIMMNLLIFYLDCIFPKHIVDKIHNFSEQCVIDCTDESKCEKVNCWRDKGYYAFESEHNNKKCMVTRWEISHFLTHMFLGYFTNIYVSLPISIGFEIYEHYKYDCGSYLDLVYNFSGFVVGNIMRHGF